MHRLRPTANSGGTWRVLFAAVLCVTACSADSDEVRRSGASEALTFRADVEPVRSVGDAMPGVFIPPFSDCQGEVCTQVAISGCTQEGKYFPEMGSCEVVRTQRPYWPAAPAGESRPDDPRLQDREFMAELAWAATQIESTGCTCCHDAQVIEPSQWDIRAQPIWLDSLSDSGLALFTGLADSSVLGAYPAAQNNGFERSRTGIPTTDPPRMQALLRAELARRGISEAEAKAVPPFGGPIYENRVAKPSACGMDEGVAPDGTLLWNGGPARYAYVTAADAQNPGVPPNLDLPEGTIWRLDVLASRPALGSGSVVYGATPSGSFQTFPESAPAEALEPGHTYRLYVLRDVGLPLANCVFEFGTARSQQTPPAASMDANPTAPSCTAEGGSSGFGTRCSDAMTHGECGCGAPYCAIQPGQSEGYCTATDCDQDPNVCPEGWSCFDLSRFQPGAPSICLEPSS